MNTISHASANVSPLPIFTPISLQDAAVVLPESGYGLSPQEKSTALNDQATPDFSLPTLDGGEVTLSEFQDQPVLINFWASWCLSCRDEIPALVASYDQRCTAFIDEEVLFAQFVILKCR